jgi:hypothetical protein
MGIVNYPNGLASFGIPIVPGIPGTKGSIYFVDYGSGSDSYNGKSVNKAFKTIAKAYASVATNVDDVICLIGSATHVLTEILAITKNRIHFVGMDGTPGRMYGQNAKISMGVTTAVTDIHAVKNIGVRNTFVNIKFISNNTLTEHTSCFGEGGEYTAFYNCGFEAPVKMNSATFAEVLLNGDSTQFYNCTFGSTSTPDIGNVVRPRIITTAAGVAGGADSCKDILFKGCKFYKHAGGTAGTFVTITAAADFTRGFMEFEDCRFIANKTGSLPAVAIALGASLTASQVLLSGTTIAFNCTKVGTGTGIISGQPAIVATATIGIQAT